ncbi:MAG: hypothetical protein LAN71_05920 [Acidobacteriia bacterium]|nr:hypothetical protein [Terriglobia bacterium]
MAFLRVKEELRQMARMARMARARFLIPMSAPPRLPGLPTLTCGEIAAYFFRVRFRNGPCLASPLYGPQAKR